MSDQRRRGAFLDRDGTIVREAHYLADPDQVELVDGATDAIRLLKDAGYVVVIVTNQSGIARGLYSQADFDAVQARLDSLLASAGASADAVFHCPHHPDFSGPCDCRKPQLGMYTRAARDLGIALDASIYVGDRLKDVLPALATGGTGYLVLTGYGAAESAGAPEDIRVVDDLAAAARSALADVDTPPGRR